MWSVLRLCVTYTVDRKIKGKSKRICVTIPLRYYDCYNALQNDIRACERMFVALFYGKTIIWMLYVSFKTFRSTFFPRRKGGGGKNIECAFSTAVALNFQQFLPVLRWKREKRKKMENWQEKRRRGIQKENYQVWLWLSSLVVDFTWLSWNGFDRMVMLPRSVVCWYRSGIRSVWEDMQENLKRK